ncbi:MAG TPA: Bor family protein [Thermoanaerobaculia bacterium]|nr:Bor family protein [Thermoanaerobaculia bacterium]
MRRTRPVLVGLAVLLLSAGCFRHTYVAGAGAPEGKVIYEHWHHHWVFGLIGEQAIELAEMCPSGNATIHEEMTFLNGVINVLIGAIYSPRTVSVRCDDGRMAEIELEPEQLEKIARDPAFLDWVEQDAAWRAGEVRVALSHDPAEDDLFADGSTVVDVPEVPSAEE